MGKTYAHTAAKFGKERANKQAIAIAMKQAGRSRKPSMARTLRGE